MMSKIRRGFTLVEMLIVIVIIGILAAALIPRLTGAQGRARDTARKADLSQLSTAMASFNGDNGVYPTTGGNISNLNSILSAYLTVIPKDPSSTNLVMGLGSGSANCQTAGSGGQYQYQPITKGGTVGGAFVIMANTETDTSSNRFYSSPAAVLTGSVGTPAGCINRTTNSVDLNAAVCTSISAGAFNINGTGGCAYVNGQGQGKYIITN